MAGRRVCHLLRPDAPPLSIFYFWLFVWDPMAVSAPYPFGGEFCKEPLGFLVLEPVVLSRIQENPIFTIYFNS
jgi:hypothetical protein